MPSKRDRDDRDTLDRDPRDIITRDVEDLVQEIRENLRLKARPARKDRRVAPYTTTHGTVTVARRQEETEPKDPYEALQRLLESNKLVAEAVRRLQQDLTDFSRKPFLYPDEESECRVLPPVCRHLGVM